MSELDQALGESRELVLTFNGSAVHTRIDVWCIRGQIVESDTDAAKAISSEIAAILADMQQGIVDRDAAAIRESARKARALGGMLDEASAEKVSKSVEKARAAAKEIVKTIEERGHANLILVADSYVNEIATARTAFLDLEEPTQATEGEMLAPVLPKGLDLDEDVSAPEGDGDGNPEDVDASRAVDEDAANYFDMVAASPADE